LLHNPLYQNNNFTAEKILFNIAGGDNLNMFEVDKISKAINLENPKAKIIFGISKNIKYKNKVKATVLMTGPGKEIKIPEVKVIPKVEKKAVVKVVVKKKGKSVFAKASAKRGKIIKRKIKMPDNMLMPVFDKIPFINQPEEMNVKRINITEAIVNEKPKKALRRSALEIKKAEEQKEKEQSVQEKEWEIPAFLRLKK